MNEYIELLEELKEIKNFTYRIRPLKGNSYIVLIRLCTGKRIYRVFPKEILWCTIAYVKKGLLMSDLNKACD